jgi:hypothetical protein
MLRRVTGLALIVLAGGCASGAYYDIDDRYVIGMRWFDRGRYDHAMHYWKPLAEAGDCDAQYRYGTLFMLGAGVPKSPATALEWWQKAANQGQYRAQVALGHAYSREAMAEGTFLRRVVLDCREGCEVPEDPVTAYTWMLLARTSVPPSMEEFRQGLGAWQFKLESRLTPDQKADAGRRAAEWRPSPARCTPRVLK